MPIIGMEESFPDIDIREEIRRDTLPVQFSAADTGVAGGIDFLAKHCTGYRQLRDFMGFNPFHGLNFGYKGFWNVNAVGISVLKHQFSCAPFRYILHDGVFQFRFGSPVALEPLKYKLFSGLPDLQFIGPGAIGDALQGFFAFCRFVIFCGIGDVAVPASLGDGPFFVDDAGRSVAKDT